jgi:hypothetical protein
LVKHRHSIKEVGKLSAWQFPANESHKANFLLDSESRLRAALTPQAAESPATGRHLRTADPPMISKLIEFGQESLLGAAGVAVVSVFAFVTLKTIRLDALPDLSILKSSFIRSGIARPTC